MTHLDKLAKSYEVENYLEYIVEVYINGNFSYIGGLTKKLKRNEIPLLMEVARACLSERDYYRFIKYIQ